jgi:hypothetical protein
LTTADKKLFGLVNCCNRGAPMRQLFSNLALILSASGPGAGGFSSYTYDVLFT